MRAPISVTRVTVGSAANHPLLNPTDFVRGLAKSKNLELLLPHEDLAKCKETLQEFWSRWRAQYGEDHTIFQEVRKEDLCLTLPVRLHGDEGRSFLPELGAGFLWPQWIRYSKFSVSLNLPRQEEKPYYDNIVAEYVGAWHLQNK